MADTDSMQSLTTVSKYKFSAVGLDALVGASEYTLATIAVDVSGSVQDWRTQLEKCIKVITSSCKSSPREDNLLLRVVKFNQTVSEVHGFRLLAEIDPKEYDGILSTGGNTALFDAVHTSIEATGDYGKLLVDQGDMSANAVIYVLTDGEDNSSKQTEVTIKNAKKRVVDEEKLESVAVILVGLGYSQGSTVKYLDKFKKDANLDQFVDLTELFAKASPEKALAKLAGYVSQSISSTSQALASGSSAISSSLLTF
jgi:uncharacterized protein YegL